MTSRIDNTSLLTKAIAFAILIFIGILFSSLTSLIPAYILDIPYESIAKNPQIIQKESPAWVLRLILFLNQILLFLFPVFIYSLMFYKDNTLSELQLNKSIRPIWIIGSILFLLGLYPWVNFVYYLNNLLPLQDWMKTSEQNVAEMLSRILESDNSLTTLGNILLIAVTPAICEELVFRGMIQRYIEKYSQSAHLAIWIASVIFSLIHFQFQGFFSRILLGAGLGYLFFWTRNLWVPIFMHFINNLLPILVLQYSGEDITQPDQNGMPFSWYVLPISALGLIIVYLYFFKKRKKDA